ncbi:hypothetical protein AB0F03_33465 [Streptomyces sp. NPDC028722]|uniref:hypothetical protein n=1 Tax=Streptomyces sp. NPDC028722 TaxID=3155016 RepID=UPI0033EB7685
MISATAVTAAPVSGPVDSAAPSVGLFARYRTGEGEAWRTPVDQCWSVTMPTLTCDGRMGTQTFAVHADTADQAIALAADRARTDAAARRRRLATVNVRAATVSRA